MTDKELTIWEHLDSVIRVLTCKEMGAWLYRRDKKVLVAELEKIKEEILEYHCIKCYGTCETYCPYNDCIEPKDVIEDLQIIDKHITELKGE